MKRLRFSTLSLLLGFSTSSANAAIIAREDFDGGATNLISYTASPNAAGGFSSTGDLFGVMIRGVDASVPFNLSDDSVVAGAAGGSPFAGDVTGPVGIAKDGNGVFGITDTWNDNTSNGEVTGTWRFDISSTMLPLVISADMVAMHDFAGSTVNTNVDFFYSIDGSSYQPLFTSSISFGESQSYTMDDGDVVTYDDPLNMNGIRLTNVFQTISAGIVGSGSVLDIQVRTNMDGTEAFAFDNLTVSAVPEPSSVAAMALVGVAAGYRRFRRRR